ncbi:MULTISPECIES: hybrid sensor histidine kinase/response regulator transcription factor [unclassified Polaribacter]|uniref:hybrid sensor histidine kinase/response regulator transcription factor n=1 Tax=unclassified Polaribacter TaxID=196858 RepID=UPI0011BFBCFE|nr:MULTISPECIES: hybrid sensor histidine kinase/response regulator transcription factor [unclassified Polaribacter]TXD50422.1 response regulator [Polaribacter sp. IC063]TXD57808.1 response regulator [Polaribacter sp. IC066]
MKQKTTLFFYVLVSYCFFTFAQEREIQFTHISTSEGLSQSSVIAIHQDKLGQMWFGTRDGLNKYDGNSFTIYRNNSDDKTSISNNDILSILEDKEGFIWIGTHNGLNKYDPEKNTFTNYFHSNSSNSLSNNTVWTLKEMSNGEIWIGTSDGLSIYNKTTDSFTNIFNKANNELSLVGDHILSILETKNKAIYIGTTSGLSHLIQRTNSKFTFKNYTNYNENKKPIYIQYLLEDRTQNILIASKNEGLLYLNPFKNILRNYLSEIQQKKVSNDIRELVFDDHNQLWIGTYNGLHVLKNNKSLIDLKNEINDSKSLSKNSIKSILKDKKGSIWIGTYYGGLNIWDTTNVNFINFSENNNSKRINYNVISSIENYKNLLFFGTEGKGINIFNTKTNSIKYIDRKNNSLLLDDNIKSLLIDENKLWVGTFNSGIAIYDLETNTFQNDKNTKEIREFLRKTGVYSIKKDKNKNLWFGTFGLGVIKYNPKNKTIAVFKNNITDHNSLSNNLVRSITIDSKNNVWASTQRGLNKITSNNKVKRYFYDSNVQSGDDIAVVFEDKDSTIWIGTKAKGLFRLAGETFMKIELFGKKGNISNIHSILEDDKKNLWISTNEGLINYNIETQKTSIYNQKDGLISNEFNDNSSLKIGNSQFYFGGPNGITSFNTAEFTTNSYVPQVLITDFRIKNKSVKTKDNSNILKKTIGFTNNISLTYQEGNFSIQFAIPNFINSQNNSYQYRLKGLEEDWIFTTENSASYTIQDPGDYIFELKGANNDGLWNQKPTTLKIYVSPAPWRSWWAFLLYGLLIATVLYFLLSIQKSKTRLKHALDLEQLENEKIEENNKAKLEFFTNISHEFRTPLTLILGPLQNILSDYKGNSKMYKKLLVVENSAKHLLQLINRLMDFRKLENNLFKLEAAEGNIVKFLKEIFLSFTEYAKDGDYDFNFHTTEDVILVYYDRYKLERVFYNLISNAFRYTPKNGAINIRIKEENNNIIISIEDTGVGISSENHEKIFDRFFEVTANNKPNTNYNKGTGIGLSIVKNIVNLHKGALKVKNNKNNTGSIFNVILPSGKNHLNEDEIIKDFKFSDDVSQYVTQLSEPIIILEDELSDKINNKDKNTILLVEDNKPLRKFMRDLLKENYNILEAENGKTALKIAIKHLPNLIVSDVVMPFMTGTELCSAIKNEIKTSHIPIILLTSRSALIYKLEGLESGADDYISKPFDVNEFKIRIKNLLNSTNRLKDKFSEEGGLISNEVILSSLDEKLYKSALEIVEANIANETFNIPFFCSELGVSRTMLFIKIKAWTNFTPNDFIQHFRMKRAAQLLEQGKINISEVSYKVGFKNPKYFSKCFLKKYGETPSRYANKFSEHS